MDRGYIEATISNLDAQLTQAVALVHKCEGGLEIARAMLDKMDKDAEASVAVSASHEPAIDRAAQEGTSGDDNA